MRSCQQKKEAVVWLIKTWKLWTSQCSAGSILGELIGSLLMQHWYNSFQVGELVPSNSQSLITCQFSLKKRKPLDVWFSHPQFKKMFYSEWKKLEKVPIKKWSRENFGSMKEEINCFEEEISRTEEKMDQGVDYEENASRREALKTEKPYLGTDL
ncbi:uncharacterized protein DS421_15g514250 [Arachis hypogaea]|nr:uncharacterized protein DS421_15g514250 [Arachis hypogaea]